MTATSGNVDDQFRQAAASGLTDSVSPRLDALARRAAEYVAARLDELAEAWYERMAEDPELAYDDTPEWREAGIANARRDIGREVRALLDGFVLPTSCPVEVLASARLAVGRDFTLWATIKAYRAGNAVQWEAWLEAVESLDVDAPTRVELLRRGSRFMFDYADRCSTWMEREYTRELESRVRSEEQRRMQAVKVLLDGGLPDQEALDYPLEGAHLALIVSGPDGAGVVSGLAAEMHCQMLALTVEPGTRWVWLATAAPRRSSLRRAILQLRPPSGTVVAVGGPATGAAGFRQAHAEAEQAQRVAEMRPVPVTLYEDVALEALALRDERGARALVARELGALAADDERSATLRTTLRAYFGAAQHASSAAAMLGVHERTVANRLRAVEERLGHPVRTRHAELDTALRLHELLLGPRDAS